MLSQKFLIFCMLAIVAAAAALQVQSSTSKTNENVYGHGHGNEKNRTGRIMKILNEPKSHLKHIRTVHNSPSSRRNVHPAHGVQRPMPIILNRNPVLRRAQNGPAPPPPNVLLRPLHHRLQTQTLPPSAAAAGSGTAQLLQQMHKYDHGKEYLPLSINNGKGTIYRSQFKAASHPNALTPPSQQQLQSQFTNNFKASPPFSGDTIVRPASYYPQYAKLLHEYKTHPVIQQYPLPQQHPQHHNQQQQQQESDDQQQLQQQQQQQQQLQLQQQQSNEHKNQFYSSEETLPHTFPSLYENLPQTVRSSDAAARKDQMYSVYEDPELSIRAPLHFVAQQSQKQLVYSANTPPTAPTSKIQNSLKKEIKQSPTPSKEAEEYFKFMSTNEYFLPKFDPNYKKLDEEKDSRKYYQNQHQQQPQYKQEQSQAVNKSQRKKPQYSKAIPSIVRQTSGPIKFPHLSETNSNIFYQPDADPASTIVHGSYQTGNNAFVVKSDGKKAIKHVVSNSVSIPETVKYQGTKSSSSSSSTSTLSNFGSNTHLRFNQPKQRTPEPIRFEFTEQDAVIPPYTNAPPSASSTNVQLRYKGVNSASNYNSFNNEETLPSSTFVHNNRPISVNEVDADPEDGDDMHDTGTGTYGRVPIRTSTESGNISTTNNNNSNKTSTTPATEQKDTEEFCERMCANVQDENEEIICGSDGYMYTGEAQMECYASCLHIDVTIQGKGTCSAR